MTEQTRPKTPEELGEAVGKKIEELFGAMFQEEGPASTPSSSPGKEDAVTARDPRAEGSGLHIGNELAEAQPGLEKSVSPSPVPSHAPEESFSPAPQSSGRAPELGRQAESFQELLEQIEAVVLNLEWEVSQKSISDLSDKLGEVEKFIPPSGLLRNFLAMHQRVLARFDHPEAAPHPALMKLLTASVAALKSFHESGGKEPLPEKLSEVLTEGYRTIMAVPVSDLATPQPADRQAERATEQTLPGLINDVGRKIRALEEVSQRLGRIVGVLRQGGDMSGEEITRRLGTLENLLSESVGRLSSTYAALAQAAVPLGKETDVALPGDGKAGPTGILLLLWGGMPLAVPAVAVVTATPLTRTQAEQFKDKTTISLGNRSIPRLPLKRPESAGQKEPNLPGWFVHLAWDGKNFFLLADRSLGYRQIPAGIDLESQGKIKIGATFYTVLRLARFR